MPRRGEIAPTSHPYHVGKTVIIIARYARGFYQKPTQEELEEMLHQIHKSLITKLTSYNELKIEKIVWSD